MSEKINQNESGFKLRLEAELSTGFIPVVF